MAVVVAVAVSGGVAVPVAVPVAGLTKRFFNHPKRFLNQCLGVTRNNDMKEEPGIGLGLGFVPQQLV